jgi:hypothetical protein
VALHWYGIAYSVVVRYEEQQLAVTSGEEYLDSLAAVHRWLPFLIRPSGKARIPSSPPQILLAELYVVCIIVAPLLKEFIVVPSLE